MSDQRRGGIAWTEQTWNPIRGCSRVSEGCRNCYAEKQAGRFAGPGQPYEGLIRFASKVSGLEYSNPKAAGSNEPKWSGVVKVVEERLNDPLRWTRPRMVFVNSMSDLFHEALTDEEIARVFAVMALAPHHTFQVLAKRAKRMRDWFVGGARPNIAVYDAAAALIGGSWSKMPGDMAKARSSGGSWWPLPNVWLGVSVEDQASADERIPHLLETPAAVRWVSYEPALGPVDFTPRLEPSCCGVPVGGNRFDEPPECCGRPNPPLDWIVVGGESGPGARPFDLAWARSTLAAGRAAGVPIFVKQLGAMPHGDRPGDGGDASNFLRLADRKGGDLNEWPADLRVREWPKAAVL